MSDDVFHAALAWLAAGAAVLPAATDGSKRPGLREWKPYQQRRPEVAEVAGWFSAGHPGMGVVCGQVSGWLEMVEFEGRSIAAGQHTATGELAAAVGLGELWETVTTGYGEWTPGGGLHLFYRIAQGPVPGNVKVARRAASAQELLAAPEDRVKVLVETRGEGGWVVCAPSNGSTHPSGLPWTVAFGSPETIPTISREQRDDLIGLLSTLDEMPPTVEHAPGETPPLVSGGVSLLRPGDDFEAKTTWTQILEPHGWTRVWTDRRGRTYWRRPGKREGCSATTGGAADGRDRLWVFSSSTQFEPETTYTKLGGYAVLNHGGDYKAAVGSLRSQGFGDDSQASLVAGLVAPPRATAVGTVATATAAGQPSPGPSQLSAGAGECDVALWAAEQYALVLRYSPGAGWHAWDGRSWEEQHRDGSQWTFARLACAQVPNPKGLLKWTAAATIEAVERMMRREPGMTTAPGAWNPDPHMLNGPSGVVDLRTGQVHPHDAKFMCTRITRYSPNSSAHAPRFFQFLAETFGGDEELVSYVQTLLGYSLFGHNTEQIVVLCHGNGGNGKSTLLDAVQAICGNYAAKANSEWLMVRHNGPHPSEMVALDGPRIVLTSEVTDAGRFDEQRLKEISGGGVMTARKLYGEFYTFTPVCTLFNSANQRPEVRQGGRSLFRRLVEIPFNYEVPDDKKDGTLPELFLTQPYGEAIMAWLVAGAVNYTQGGLKMPTAVREATDEYQRESLGAIGDFVEDRCLIGGGSHVQITKDTVYAEYERWCLMHGEAPVKHKTLTGQLRSMGVGEARTAAKRFYTNITILSQVERG